MPNKVIKSNVKINFAHTNEKKYNKEFSLVDIAVCYSGRNRNYSDLPKEVIMKALPSLVGCPIIGEYLYKDDGSEDFGTHGGKITMDSNGIKFEQTTKPFGFIPQESVDAYEWKTITEKDGHTKHDYLFIPNAIVWSGRYSELDTLINEKHPQSMEIKIEQSYEDEDGYTVAKEINFSALCILGQDVEPCFESSSIGSVNDYTLDSFKQDYKLMLDEYNKFQIETKENKSETKGVIKMDLEKLNNALSTITFEDNCGNKIQKYELITAPTENQMTVIDREDDYKLYAIDCTMTEEGEIAIDFDSKVEKTFAIVDKTEDSDMLAKEVIEKFASAKTDVMTAELSKEFNAKIDEMADEYKSLNDEYTKAEKELANFRLEKEKSDKIAHKAEIDEVINHFAKKIGRDPKFLVYKAKLNVDEATVDKVTEDLTLMAGQSMMEGNKKNFSYTPVESKVTVNKEDKTTSRYGNLLAKFSK